MSITTYLKTAHTNQLFLIPTLDPQHWLDTKEQGDSCAVSHRAFLGTKQALLSIPLVVLHIWLWYPIQTLKQPHLLLPVRGFVCFCLRVENLSGSHPARRPKKNPFSWTTPVSREHEGGGRASSHCGQEVPSSTWKRELPGPGAKLSKGQHHKLRSVGQPTYPLYPLASICLGAYETPQSIQKSLNSVMAPFRYSFKAVFQETRRCYYLQMD